MIFVALVVDIICDVLDGKAESCCGVVGYFFLAFGSGMCVSRSIGEFGSLAW